MKGFHGDLLLALDSFKQIGPQRFSELSRESQFATEPGGKQVQFSFSQKVTKIILRKGHFETL